MIHPELYRALEQIGHTVTPQEDGTTVVQVPHKQGQYRFHPTGEVTVEGREPNLEDTVLSDMNMEAPEQDYFSSIAHLMDHTTKHFPLYNNPELATKFNNPELVLNNAVFHNPETDTYERSHHIQLHRGPHTSFLSTPNNNVFNQEVIDPSTENGIREVLYNNQSPEPLIDHLRETYPHLFSYEENEQYCRAYSKVINTHEI